MCRDGSERRVQRQFTENRLPIVGGFLSHWLVLLKLAMLTPFLDVTTWESLELYSCRPKRSKKKSVAWKSWCVTCATNSGARILRSCLLQPSADVAEINDRPDFVDELMINQSVMVVTVLMATIMFSDNGEDPNLGVLLLTVQV